jgi:hypothetical protein
MTLGERCDEIVRLIDETLLDCESTSSATPLRAERLDQGVLDFEETLAKTA